MQRSAPSTALLMGLGLATSIVGVVLMALLLTAMAAPRPSDVNMPDLLQTPTPAAGASTATPAGAPAATPTSTPTRTPASTRTPTPTRTATPSPVPTATSQAATPLPAPTGTAVPGVPPTQPTATPDISPTATRTPVPGSTPAQAPTPVPTATPTPVSVTALASCGTKPFPVYPGASFVSTESADVEALLRDGRSFIATQTQWSLNANAIGTLLGVRVFSTDATRTQVLDYYESGMPDSDWTVMAMQPTYGFIEGSCNRGAKRIAIATFLPFETGPLSLAHGGYIIVLYQ